MNSLTDGKRMFQNPVMELLSRSSPGMMIVFHLIIATGLIYIGSVVSVKDETFIRIIIIFVSGIIVWSFAEYLMHRYVFHFENDLRVVRAFHYAMHGYHHEVPHDYNRLFMPPVPALLFLAFFFGVFYIFLGTWTWYFLPGFEIGYLIYSLIHYTVHRRVPKNQYLNKLWLHHAQHHYNYPDAAYGVSSPFWDIVFGTMPSKQSKVTKQ